MGKYFLEAERVKVTFPDGEWAEIKEELTQGDQDYIMTQMTKSQGGDKVSISLELGQLPLLERSILDWSFTNGKGEKVPVNRENISRLRLRYRTKLLIEINKLNEAALEFSKN